MIDPTQFRHVVVRPTLEHLGLWSEVAEWLLLATTIAESGLVYLKQIRGPALSVFQIEPATARDIWGNFLTYRPELLARTMKLQARHSDAALATDLRYACALARLVYYRRPEALPAAPQARALAEYWKAHYNTEKGAGTVAGFVAKAGPYLPGP